MALTKTLEIDLVGSSLELVYTDYTGTKLPAEEFPVCGIKSVKGIAQIGYGARDASNQRRMTYPFNDMLQVVVEMDQKNSSIKFDIQSVTNQAGWTPDAAGLDQAVADITAWAATCGSGGSADVVAELASVIKAEDATHVSGDNGIMALAVRNTALIDLTNNDRDYSPIAVDVKGRPIVTGNVGGFTEKQYYAVTTVATAYTANDNIGGVQTLTNILRSSGGTGILEDISFWALANQKPNLLIDFWHTTPSAGTYTNDTAQIIAGDHAKWIGSVEVATGDWKDTGLISRCSLTGIGLSLKGVGSANIYMTIQDKTGVTFGSTAGLFFTIGELQD